MKRSSSNISNGKNLGSIVRFVLILLVLILWLPLAAGTSPVPISVDQEIDGEITAGEEQVFLLQNLLPGQRVYVQRTVASNVNQLNWLLEDNFGRIIAQNLTGLGDLGPVSLMGGTYRLTVRGETPSAVGTYSFIVHAVNDTNSSLPLDVLDSRSLTGVGASHAFELSLNDPGPVRLFFGEAGPSQLSYRLTDALGNLREDWTTSAPTVTAPYSLTGGVHRLEVRGRNGYSGNFSLRARPLTDPVPVALPLDGSADYDSEDISETTEFQFNLSDARSVFITFDFVHGSSAGQWRLERADGSVISDWSNNMSPPSNPWQLLAGDYRLSVRSRSTTPITGTANLHEVVDSSALLSPDMPVTADILIPGQTHRFELSGIPGGLYLLDQIATDANQTLNWQIEDALGRTVLARTSSLDDVEDIALRGGDYTLTVTGESAATGFAEFVLTTMTVVDIPTSLGSVIIDGIVQPGEIRRYGFTSPANRMLSIERQASSNSFGLSYALFDAAGREIVSRGTSLPTLTERSLVGGDYVLIVRGRGGATGDYTLALTDQGPANFSPSGTPIALDSLVESTISSGSSQRWLLSLSDTTRVYFSLVEGATNLRWTLFDASGQALFSNARALLPGFDDLGAFSLATGEYTVEFELLSGGPSDYAFQAVDSELTEIPINLDEVINSGPTASGSRNDYLFTIPTDDQFYFELLQGENQLRWRLEHSSGESVFESSLARVSTDSLGPFSLRAGDYRLVFEGTSSAASSHQFQIHSVTDLNDTLTLGAVPVPVTAAMAMPGQTHDYALTIEPGFDRLYIEVQSGNNALRYSLIDSAGRAVIDRQRLFFQEFDDSGPLAVEPGEYRLLVTMGSPTTSNYELTLHAPQSSAARTVALDQLETWNPSGPGEVQRYLIDLDAASTRAFFDPRVGAPNVSATLTHLPSGWQLFADVALDFPQNANRGPWYLPPGQYELTLQAEPNAGEPGWQISSVMDQNAGPIAIDEVIVAEFPTRGSRLSYTLEPEDDGQALIFDLMSRPLQNRWVLIDPVGEAVFGPANASDQNTHDQGPIPLAAGVYTLTFSNTGNEIRDWFFQVASSGATIEVPEGCAACSALDVVFTFDTSSSMNPVNQAMCDLTGDLIQALADDGIPISSRFWGISDSGTATCLTSDVVTELGSAVPGSPPPWMLALDQCEEGGLAGSTENWGPAAAVVAGAASWDEDAVRLLIPVVDEGSYCGDPVNQFDIESVYYARQIAAQNNVVVSPLLPAIAPDPVRAMAGLITVGTGGISTVADFDLEDVLPVARAIAVAACGTQQAVAVPQFNDISPLPGTLLPSGVPLVLSGRVVPVNQLRPVLEVEINGQPSSVLDGSGSFFATIELQPGPNTVTISAVEACGPTVLEIELIGAGDANDPWAGFGEVTDLIEAEFAGTSFDQPNQRLLVEVAARNPGAPLTGPLLMAVGLDLHPGVELLNADGVTPNGEPYVVLVPDGEVLPAGSRSALRSLAFSNPDLQAIDFEPRWLLPANQAPHFTSVPTTRATVGRPWVYPASATDGDGDNVFYSLLVAPDGMNLDSTELTWTPPAAGTYDVVLRASDGRGGVSRQSFSVNVVEAGFNAPPIFTSTPVIQAPIGFDYRYNVGVTDPDGDAVGFALFSAPTGMTIDSVSGLVSWMNAQPGRHTVIIEADDGEGGQATQSYTLFVGEPATTPPGPAFISTPVAYAAVATQYRYRYALSPPGATPTVTLAQAPAAMTLDAVARTLEWLPEAADLGPHVIELIAIDGDGQQSTQRFDLTVLDSLPNQAPYLTSTPPRSAVVGQTWTYQADAVDPEFEALIFSLNQAPPGMSVDPDSGELSWTPPGGTASSVTVTLLVTDSEGLSAEQVFDISVRAGNAAPVLTNTPPTAVFVGETYSHLFIANDADNDPLTFRLLSGPTGMILDAEAGWLSWPTAGVAAGTYEFGIEVADDWGGSTSQGFIVNLVEDNQAPTVAIAIERQPACAIESVAVCVQTSDNVGLASRELLIDGQLQSLSAGCVDWTPASLGNVPALATATDVSGLSATDSRTLQVADCNDEQAPVVTLGSPTPEALLLEPTPLIVSIDDNTPAALTWAVSIRADLNDEPILLAEGSGSVDQGEVAVIDPTNLPEGSYWISIQGADGAQTGGIEYRINVGSGFKPGRVRSASADVILPLAGVPLTIGRSYDSLDAGLHGQTGGDLGPGWRLALSGSVEDSALEAADPDAPLADLLAEPFNASTRVAVVKPNGERVGFSFVRQPKPFPATFDFEPIFEPDPGVTDELRAVDGVTAGFGIIPYNPSIYELKTSEQVVYVFSETKGLIEIRDALGGVLTIDDNGVQSSTGLSIDYIRDGQGRVAEVRLPSTERGVSNRILYGYDAIGNLVTVTDLGGGVTSFQYANNDYPHHVTSVIDPRGVILTQQIYDDEGRLLAQCPADGNSATLEGCLTYDYDVPGRSQTTIDARGFRTDFVYDEQGLLILERDWTDDVNFLEQRWTYSDRGDVIEYVDRAGGITTNTYDERGNQLTRLAPGGQLFTWTYGDCLGAWETATDPLGNQWQNNYTDDCLLSASTDPLGKTTHYEYAAGGLRSSIVDRLDQTWGFTYNNQGLESARTDPIGVSNATVYDNRGTAVSFTDRAGQQREYVTGDNGALLGEIWVGTGEQFTFDYDEVGLTIAESSATQSLSFDYFATGQLERMERLSAANPDWWVEYDYDGNGNVTQVTDFAGGLTVYEYDAFDQLIAISQSGSGINDKRVEFDLNRIGLVTGIRRYADLDGLVPGPTTIVEYACESCPFEVNRIEHRRPDGTTIHEMVFNRNDIGLVTQIVDAQGTHDFFYDGRGWLASASHPSLAGFNSGAYSWDDEGNWLSLPGKPGPASLSYAEGSGGHRLLSDGERTYQYDARGAVVARQDPVTGETLDLSYDLDGRLLEATLRDSQSTVLSQGSYRYSPSGARTFAEVDGVRRHFVYDGDNVILVLNDNGQVISRRLQDRAVDRPLAIDDGNDIQWLLTDQLGSIRNVVGTDGQSIAEFAYTPFGEQILGPSPSLDDPIRYTGREFDIPGGLGYFRARTYAPEIARFLAEDPLEPWHYRYAENNPLRYFDPSGKTALISYGLKACSALAKVNKILGGAGGRGAGEFFNTVMTEVASGLKGEAVDPKVAYEAIKKLFAPKVLLPCGFKLAI